MEIKNFDDTFSSLSTPILYAFYTGLNKPKEFLKTLKNTIFEDTVKYISQKPEVYKAIIRGYLDKKLQDNKYYRMHNVNIAQDMTNVIEEYYMIILPLLQYYERYFVLAAPVFKMNDENKLVFEPKTTVIMKVVDNIENHNLITDIGKCMHFLTHLELLIKSCTSNYELMKPMVGPSFYVLGMVQQLIIECKDPLIYLKYSGTWISVHFLVVDYILPMVVFEGKENRLPVTNCKKFWVNYEGVHIYDSKIFVELIDREKSKTPVDSTPYRKQGVLVIKENNVKKVVEEEEEGEWDVETLEVTKSFKQE